MDSVYNSFSFSDNHDIPLDELGSKYEEGLIVSIEGYALDDWVTYNFGHALKKWHFDSLNSSYSQAIEDTGFYSEWDGMFGPGET